MQQPPHSRPKWWYWCSLTPCRYSARAPTAARCQTLPTSTPPSSRDDSPNYHPRSSNGTATPSAVAPTPRRGGSGSGMHRPHTPSIPTGSVVSRGTAQMRPGHGPPLTRSSRCNAPRQSGTTHSWPTHRHDETRGKTPGKNHAALPHLIPSDCESELPTRERRHINSPRTDDIL